MGKTKEAKNRPGKMQRIFKQNPSVMARTIGDEVLLVPIKGELAQLQQIYALNSVGAFIWENLDGVRDLEQLTTGLISTFEVEAEEARSDLTKYVEELIDRDFVFEVNGAGS